MPLRPLSDSLGQGEMGADWIGYHPVRVARLARLTGEAISFLDETRSSDPVVQSAMLTLREISHALSTTWVPLLVRIGADSSLLAWASRPPGPMGWTATQIAGVAAVLVPPVAGGADAVATWWGGLTDADRAELIDERPHLIGNTDGIPAETRNAANRIQMAADLGALELKESVGTITPAEAQVLANIRRAQAALASNDGHADPITGDAVGGQLYIYDPTAFGGDGRIAIALGELSTAEHVAVTVSGLGSDASTLGSGQSQAIYFEARHASGDSVAVLNWTGYDAPTFRMTGSTAPDMFDEGVDVAGVVNQGAARAGAALLAADVAGINAMRAGNNPHLTVVGNSYGSTVAAIAADENDLEADDLVLTGSPGAGDADTAADFTTGTEHTWAGSASSDLVTYLGEQPGWEPQDAMADLVPGVEQLGDDPSEESFNAQRFHAESIGRDGGDAPGNTDDHGYYFEADSESLFNIGAIVGGEYDLVVAAEHRNQQPFFEPELDWDWTPFGDVHPFPDDPEADRAPTSMTHRVPEL